MLLQRKGILDHAQGTRELCIVARVHHAVVAIELPADRTEGQKHESISACFVRDRKERNPINDLFYAAGRKMGPSQDLAVEPNAGDTVLVKVWAALVDK